VRILYHHRTQAEDGQAVHIRALQRAFAEEGHEVFELSLVARAGAGAGSAPSRWSAVSRLPRFARELSEYGYGRFARPRLVAAARRHGVDFLYERYAFGNTAGAASARQVGKPLVLEVNSPMVLELGRTRGLSFPRLARRVEERVFRGADLVCAVSGVLRALLIEQGVEASRILVTPNGVELESYAARAGGEARARALADLGVECGPGLGGAPPDGLVLGFVGYTRAWHRLDLAIEALRRPALRAARLVIVGEGPAHADLREAAARAGVLERVHFAGGRPHASIPGLLSAFDVALVPAINPYASPLKLFEYMAAGLPTVAPDQENLREVLEHGVNALLVAAGDGEALGEAIERLAEPGLRARLGAAARRTVLERDLTWRANARRVVAAVEALG